MKQPRAVVLAGLVIIMTGLFLVALRSGAPPSSSFSGAPPPPTALTSGAAAAAPLASSATPVPLPCAQGSRIIRINGHRHGHSVPLEALPVACGCLHDKTLRHPAAWHHHAITHGLQLTGTCSVAVFRLGKQYSEISGTIDVDDSTGTTGGIIALYDAVVPTDSNTYRTLFENNIGSAKAHMIAFRAPVHGVQYLAVWERCCTAQNTVLDVVATLTRSSSRAGS
jgi:hypothetical protein